MGKQSHIIFPLAMAFLLLGFIVWSSRIGGGLWLQSLLALFHLRYSLPWTCRVIPLRAIDGCHYDYCVTHRHQTLWLVGFLLLGSLSLMAAPFHGFVSPHQSCILQGVATRIAGANLPLLIQCLAFSSSFFWISLFKVFGASNRRYASLC